MGNTIITIDEKKLNPKERMAIGKRLVQANDGETLVIPASKGTKSQQLDKKNPEQSHQKKSIILNKDLKSKTVKPNWMSGKNEQLIEQEQSSGLTKILKLDTEKPKKK